MVAWPWHQALGEASDNETESRSLARTALQTSTAILPSTEEWIKSNTGLKARLSKEATCSTLVESK